MLKSDRSARHRNCFAALLTVAGAVFLLFSQPGVPSPATKAAALSLLAIIFWAGGLIPEHLTALLFFLLALLLSVSPPEAVFSGFTSAAVWLVFGGLVLGAAISSTGLGRRMGRHAAVHLHGSYLRIISGLVAGAVLFSFIMPSSMGRVVLLTPITLSIAEHFGFKEGSKGRTGVLLAVILGTYIPAFSILTANVPNMVLAGMAETQHHLAIFYGSYLLLHFPLLGLVKAALLVALILFFYPDNPVEKLDLEAHQPMPLSRGEIVLSVLLAIMLLLWLTDFLHHISPAWIALAGAVILMLPGVDIVGKNEFNQKINWASIVFVAGILGMGAVISKTGLGGSIASGIISLLPLGHARDFVNYMSVSLASSLAGVAVTLPAVPAVLTPLSDSLAKATGLPIKTLLMMQVTGFATLLLPYQGPPIVVGLHMAGEKASSAAKICVPLALITVVVLLPVNFFWWKVLDWL